MRHILQSNPDNVDPEQALMRYGDHYGIGFFKAQQVSCGSWLVLAGAKPDGRVIYFTGWGQRAFAARFGLLTHDSLRTAQDCFISRLRETPPAEALRKVGDRRDSQRRRVYRWEETIVFPSDTLQRPLDECQRIVNLVCQDQGHNEVPRVLEGSQNRVNAEFNSVTNIIYLPRPYHRSLPYILHETAHVLMPRHLASHHPVFVATYIGLLERFMCLDGDELRRSAAEFKVKIV